MSLDSKGISFTCYVAESNTPMEDPATGISLPIIAFHSSTEKNGIDDQRETFVKLMTEVANSKQFEAVVHSLMPSFTLNVSGLVHTVMPR